MCSIHWVFREISRMTKVALITGGARGLGASMAMDLAENGWQVYATYKHDRSALELQNLCLHKNIIKIKCDIENSHEIEKLKDLLQTKYGFIDALVNNAGINYRETMWEITEDSWDSILNTNLKHQFFFTRKLWELVKVSKLKRIVFISSAAGQYHGPKTLHYAVAKAAVISMTKVMARYGSEDGIFVNAIAPGLIETDQTKDEFASGAADAIIKSTTLLGRHGYPQDVSSALRFLLDERQTYMTGQVLSVSGGAIL